MESKQMCTRCKSEEYIPTHQYLKFDDRCHWLCQECWDLFREFYFRGPKAVYAQAEAAR